MGERVYYEPEIETMDRASLRRLQLERLKWQVHRCYEGSEFYRERFDRAGITPDDVRSLEDITQIPPVTKQELREEQQAHPPFGRYVIAPSRQWRELHPSTGTTGTPVNTIWSQNDLEQITKWTARTMWNFGVRPGDIVQNGFSYGLWVAGMSTHYAGQLLGCFVIPIGAGMTEKHLECLLNPGATVLLSTPSFALYIAERLREKGLSPQDIPLRLGCFGGEGGVAVPATRRKIEAGLGIQAFDYYGLAEIGPTIASECEDKSGIHWVDDHILVEVLNPESKKPCAEGEAGVLVITHLTKEATPMIRYWTNDLARLTTEKCACGRTHARSEGGILGRADDMVIYKGAKFYPVQVEKVVRSLPELSDEFRILLTTDERMGTDVCTVIVETLPEDLDKTALTSKLRSMFKAELLVTPLIRIQPFESLERTTFKAKRIIDQRKK